MLAAAFLAGGLLGFASTAPAAPDSLRRFAVDSLMLTQCPGYQKVRVKQVLFAGNNVTKERILRAELDYREGDSLNVASLTGRLEENRLRLFNLRLFTSVQQQITCRDGELIVLIAVQERWYTFPVPVLGIADRNFKAWYNRPDRWRRIDYGLYLVRSNFRGRNEEIRGNLQLGFNRRYELFYTVPQLGRRGAGISAGGSYYRSHALDFTTRNDSLIAFRDDQDFPIERWYVTGGLRWRRDVQRLTTLEGFYFNEQVSDSISRRNPTYFLSGNQRRYVDMVLSRTVNERNTFAYPLTGRFVQLSLTQRAFLGSNTPPITSLLGRYARYFDLGRRFYYSASAEGRLRFARRLAYTDSHALGFKRASVRGYDAYVVDGRHYGLLRQGFSYRLLDANELRLPFFNDPRFGSVPLQLYLNTFTDAGYVAERTVPRTNQLPNQLLASVGIGLHLVTYYDRVFTLEYTRTRHGFGGFFFRSEFPI
ncbi:POTRA domain-containing protein [Hymenobacter koreensis]|uniref:POTRA domain-containing protein n=1 Tax=Hymenobacter koreensis TaxID=1084523 RepID=UPI0031ECFAAE